jgi:hypothetical protein
MNVPGPIYTVDPDSLFLGPTLAPHHVGVDESWCDVVYRQPVTDEDWSLMVGVADGDPMACLEHDGCSQWTRSAIQDWRSSLPSIVHHIKTNLLVPSWWRYPDESEIGSRIGSLWLSFLVHDLDVYLRSFAFYLDTGQWPAESERVADL